MTNDIQSQASNNPAFSLSSRFKLARETQGMTCMDAAAKLRLNEKFILMMENDHYPGDLPITFIRGYQRAYAKLLSIPLHEITEDLEPMMPEPLLSATVIGAKPAAPITSTHYFMQFFTSLIMITLIGLVAMWWYTHTNNAPAVVTAVTPIKGLTQESMLNEMKQVVDHTNNTLAFNEPVLTPLEEKSNDDNVEQEDNENIP